MNFLGTCFDSSMVVEFMKLSEPAGTQFGNKNVGGTESYPLWSAWKRSLGYKYQIMEKYADC